MGFLGSILNAAVKTVVTPLAVVEDALTHLEGNEPKHTKKLVEEIGKDLDKSLKKLSKGKLL